MRDFLKYTGLFDEKKENNMMWECMVFSPTSKSNYWVRQIKEKHITFYL